jgi:hypothetical protein
VHKTVAVLAPEPLLGTQFALFEVALLFVGHVFPPIWTKPYNRVIPIAMLILRATP